MAAPPTIKRGTKLRALKGDGESPEVFTAICSLTTKSFNQTTQTTDEYIPDCDDPDAPADRVITKWGRARTFTGSGVADFGGRNTLQTAYENDLSENWRIYLANAEALGGHFRGAFHVTQFNITGNDQQYINFDITLESDGVVTWVDEVA